jgi:hypothetical protein
MSQIITVKTDIRSFKSLESAAKSLGYSLTGNEAKIEMTRNGRKLTAEKVNNAYSVTGDSDWMGRGQTNGMLNELKNEYAKEEALNWARFTGRTVSSIKGNAKTGYEIEISA